MLIALLKIWKCITIDQILIFFLLRCKTIEKREKNRKIVDGERDLRERLGFLICDWRDLRESQSLTFN